MLRRSYISLRMCRLLRKGRYVGAKRFHRVGNYKYSVGPALRHEAREKERKFLRRLGLSLLTAAALSLVLATTAFAQQGGQTFTATLNPVNQAGASGTATVTISDNQATVEIQTQGLAAGAPHAQHVHIGGQGVCPTSAADTDGSGAISTAEGQPFYGDINVSLTTQGDVSPDSALAVDRMPVADDNGTVTYSRTFTLPAGVTAADLEGGSIVQHGVDFNGNGTYDMSAGQSSVDPSLPFEATAPAVCGELASMTMPDTGGVSLSTLMPAAAVALFGAGIVGIVILRRHFS